MIKLSLVIPSSGSKHDEESLQRLLASIEAQDFPKEELETLIIREGNSEEAKALGINRARGEIVGLFCTDNIITDRRFLSRMYEAAQDPAVVGAYTRRYHYSPGAGALDRYFALLGANDPVCWWLGKADRSSYLDRYRGGYINVRFFPERFPSIGDNGCFIKTSIIRKTIKHLGGPKFHYCIDTCYVMALNGHSRWAIVDIDGVEHRSGQSYRVWLLKRWRYVNALYFRAYHKRRWRMVSSKEDWLRICSFSLSSLILLPHLSLSIRGYRQVPDPAWFLHPWISLSLALLYGASLACHCSRLLFRHITGKKA